MRHGFVTGEALISRYQGVYARGFLLGDAVVEEDGSLTINPSLMSGGVKLHDFVPLGDGNPWGAGSVFLPSGFLMGDGMLMGDGHLMGDRTVASQSAMVQGDPGAPAK